MTHTDLLPCPFCGGPATHKRLFQLNDPTTQDGIVTRTTTPFDAATCTDCEVHAAVTVWQVRVLGEVQP